MKKLISLVFALSLTIAFTACNSDTPATTAATPVATEGMCVPAPGEICPA